MCLLGILLLQFSFVALHAFPKGPLLFAGKRTLQPPRDRERIRTGRKRNVTVGWAAKQARISLLGVGKRREIYLIVSCFSLYSVQCALEIELVPSLTDPLNFKRLHTYFFSPCFHLVSLWAVWGLGDAGAL